MTREHLDEEAIFSVARKIESTDDRDRYLNHVCGDDRSLRLQVGKLLTLYEEEQSFLESLPPGVVSSAVMPAITERVGAQIGPYKLQEELGEGGMGVVYVAEQTEPVKRKAALKIIRPGMATKNVLARFEAERQALAMMDHPNIARVLDASATESGQPYFVMELVCGVPLTDYCDERALTTAERLQIFLKVCRAVQHAHQKGVIHRDLKPSTVLVASIDGEAVPKVIDFGVAKATGAKLTEETVYTQISQLVGTPLYMSPEQVELGVVDVDTRSDVYSLGVLAYELLTGHTPFDRELLEKVGFDEFRRIIREDDPSRPSNLVSTLKADAASTVAQRHRSDPRKLVRTLRGELDWITMKALEKDRNRRYESASALAADVERYLNDQPVSAGPPSTTYALRKYARRHKAQLATIGTIAVTLVVATMVSSALATWAFREQRLARRNEQVALDAEALAQKQAQLARSRESEARSQRTAALLNQYYVQMVSGHEDWERGYLSRLRGKLMSHLAVPGEADRRGWEWYYLLSLCHPERQTLFFPGRTPFATWSPDGEYVAASGSIWRAASGANVRRIVPSTSARSHGNWSPDGRKLAWGTTSSDSCIYIWDRQTDEVSQLRGHKTSVWCLAWSPDGKKLASGGSETIVRIWDVGTRSIIKTLPAGERVTDVAWSPNGELLAAGIKWNDLKIWSMARDELVVDRQNLGAPSDTYWTRLSWHPDGEQLAVSTPQSWFLLRRPDWSLARQQDLELGAGQEIAWSPDGQSIAVTDGPVISIWEPSGDEPTRILRGHLRPVMAVAWSPDGQQLVSSDSKEEIKIWDLNSPFQPPIIASGGPVQSLSWLPNNKTLAVANESNGFVSFWNAADGQRLKVESAPVEGQSLLSPDRRLVAQLFNSDNVPEIRVLEATSGAMHSIWQGQANDVLRHAAWSNDGTKLAIRKGSGPKTSVELWDVDRETLISRWTHNGRDSSRDISQNTIAWSHDGTRIAIAAMGNESDNGTPAHQGHVYLADVAGGATVLKHNLGGWDHSGSITSLAWKPDGEAFIAGSSEGLVEAVEVDSGHVLFSTSLYNTSVNSVSWSPNGRRIAASSEGGSVKVLTSEGGEDLLAFTLEDRATSVAWSPDGKRLAAATGAGKVHVWDASRGYEFSETGRRRGELAWAYYRSPDTNADRLPQVLKLAPDALGFWELRGHASAELGDFDRAAEEFAKALEPDIRLSFRTAIDYGYALLGAGKLEAYRQHCTSMLEQFADTKEPSNVGLLAWLCSVEGNGEFDTGILLRLTRAAESDKDNKGESAFVLSLGAALCRDGRYEEAAGVLTDLTAVLEQSADPTRRGELASSLYFLAMARQQLGHPFQARRLRDDAGKIAEEASLEPRWSGGIQPSWAVGVQLKLLNKEARALIP